MIGAKIANMEHGGDRKSVNQVANLPLDKISQPQAAKMLNVNKRTLSSAIKVKELILNLRQICLPTVSVNQKLLRCKM